MLNARAGWWRLITLGFLAIAQLVLVAVIWCSSEHWWLPVWARVLWIVVLVAQLVLAVLGCIGKAAGEQAPLK